MCGCVCGVCVVCMWVCVGVCGCVWGWGGYLFFCPPDSPRTKTVPMELSATSANPNGRKRVKETRKNSQGIRSKTDNYGVAMMTAYY